MITFLPLGGATDIGASCYYLDVEGTGIVLDCGSHPRRTGADSLPRFALLEERNVDVALITHAHQDHIDSLPYLVQHHPYIRIVSTPQTRALAEITLHNSANILREQLTEDDPVRPYTHEEIDLLIQSIEWRSYKERFTVDGYRHGSDEPVTASFHDAGHILGSAGILIEHGGRSVYYTGDINLDRQSLLPGASLPDGPVDVLVIETTHGATDDALLPDRLSEERRLARTANAVLERGGGILIPVFALGKMQELLSTLWRLMEKGQLARTDILTGGVGARLNTVYDRNRFVVPYNDTAMVLGDIPVLDLFEADTFDALARRQGIVLATSGMVIEGTASYRLAQHWLLQHRNAIFTVGYMDPETPGHRIRHADRNGTVQLTPVSEPQTVRCDIERFRFSAHSTRSGLLSIVERLNPRVVILVHGDMAAIDWMGYSILKAFPHIKVHGAEVGKPVTLF
ncbi:MAG: MBL fold metallo-hydrolase [Bacteroidetes bacterium]|nr:MAG: MBL fold metallo-hydrolase [Bacteroidota bacterium]